MASFYGQVAGDRGRTTASRCGTRSIRSSAQSWDGSVIVVAEEIVGETIFSIEVSEDSSIYGRTLFSGTIEELKDKLNG